MRLVTGDECGLLKETIPELGRKKKNPSDVIAPYNAMPDVTKDGVSRIDPKEIQKRSRGVVDMVWMNEENSSFGVLRKNGSIDLWNFCFENKKSFGRYSLEYSTTEDDFVTRPIGLGYFNRHNRLCAGDMQGNLFVLNANDKKNCNVIQTFNAYTTNKGGKTISYTPGKLENSQLATAIGFDTFQARAAVGGREREVSLVDISTGKLVFKGKNLPPDPQTLLQQPVWPTAIQFLNKDSNLMAVGTAYKQVRLYDVRENTKTRRPTSLTPEGLLEYRVTCMCQVDEHELVVGDTAGYIYSLDIRRMGRDSKGPANRDMARYVGPAGSVRQLKKHPTLPRLTAVGLDRMLRVYDTKKRKQLDCVYLNQRLSSVLVHKHDGFLSNDDDFDVDDGDIDQDDIVRDYVDSESESENFSESASKSHETVDDDSSDEKSSINMYDTENENTDEDTSVSDASDILNEQINEEEDKKEIIITGKESKRQRCR